MYKLNPNLRWWVTPKLPGNHIFIDESSRPKELSRLFGIYIRRWLVHPLKRRLAKYYLVILRKFFGIKVIGITGSSGKTTTKEMIASILGRDGRTVSSFANIDPVYNIPTTILRCTPSTKYLVLEMSVEYPGEMDFYLWLSVPDVGVITNIYPTHTEFFGDVNGVFREKQKLVKALPQESIAVINGADKLLRNLEDKLKAKIVWFGNGGEFKSLNEKVTYDYKTEFILERGRKFQRRLRISLPIFGYHFVSSALAASAVAHSLGISQGLIKRGLENFMPPPHRMRIIKHKSGAIIIDDSYNNNPIAAKEALTSLDLLPGKKIVVFGDMLELGKLSKKYHSELGELIGNMSVAKLICIGREVGFTVRAAKRILGKDKVIWLPIWQDAETLLKAQLKRGVLVLVKGSRSLGLENLVAKLS